MRRWLTSALGALLLASLVSAAPQALAGQPIRCTLTGKKIEKCCCEKRGKKLYCTLAKKTIAKCCCEPRQTPKRTS